MSAESQYIEAVRTAPSRGSGLHSHIMRITRLGMLAELTPERIMGDIYGIAGVRRGEPEEAYRSASHTTIENYTPQKVSRFKPKFKSALESMIQGVSDSEMDLIELSPNRLTDQPHLDGKLLLEALYSPDEILFIGDVYDKQVKTVAEWLQTDLTASPHIIPNPMTGRAGKTSAGQTSFRCESTVRDLRYAVCEMDDVPMNKQVAFWIKWIEKGIPVAAVIHSGGKSLHGWVKVDCGLDHGKWDKEVKGWLFEKVGKSFGFDQACKTKARLSRLPGHSRKGTVQRLLYLNQGA